MKNPHSSVRNTITAARRGQIIQRVIVDGWSSAEAARSFGVHKRQVEAWVADFRRSGMASLRQGPHETFSAEVLRLTVPRPVRTAWRRIAARLRRLLVLDALVQPVPLRRSRKDGPR